jgi:arylsulfatase A-like enzyme
MTAAAHDVWRGTAVPRPNILFIMADDHAANAVSAYGGRLNKTPGILRSLLVDRAATAWRTAKYYRYWMHLDPIDQVWAHYGVRTDRYKLVHYYADVCGQPGATDDPRPPEWELSDLAADPFELRSVYHEPGYADVVADLTARLYRLQAEVGDTHDNAVTGTAPTTREEEQ